MTVPINPTRDTAPLTARPRAVAVAARPDEAGALPADSLSLSGRAAPVEPAAGPAEAKEAEEADDAPALPRGVQAALDGALDGRKAGQCKVFVERQLGAHFPGQVAAKSMLRPANHPGFDVVTEPRPGDVFVMKSGSIYGHAGFVKALHPDGSLTVVDSNWDGDGVVHTHTLSAATVKRAMLGYLRSNEGDKRAYWKPALEPRTRTAAKSTPRDA